MGTIQEQQRVEAYRNASEDVRALYVSDALTEQVDKLYTLFGITEPFKVLSDIVGDTILGFTKITDMPRLFQTKLKVSADESQRITSQLIELLAPVVQREEEASKVKKEDLTKLADTFSKPEGLKNSPTPNAQYADVVEPIRTMSGDMNRVHGYGAYRTNNESNNDNAENTDGGDSSSD